MTKLSTARQIHEFAAGKTVARVAEPLDSHTRFVFTDGSALLVIPTGPAFYTEPAGTYDTDR